MGRVPGPGNGAVPKAVIFRHACAGLAANRKPGVCRASIMTTAIPMGARTDLTAKIALGPIHSGFVWIGPKMVCILREITKK